MKFLSFNCTRLKQQVSESQQETWIVHTWERAPVPCWRPIQQQDWDRTNLRGRGYSEGKKLAKGEKAPSAWWAFSKGSECDLNLLIIQQGYDEHIQQQDITCQVVTTDTSTNQRIPTLESHYSHLKRTLLLPAVIHPKLFNSHMKIFN